MREYIFQINPVPASRPRVSRYGTYYLPTYRAFKDAMTHIIASEPSIYKREQGFLYVDVVCYVQRPAKTVRQTPNGDVDNYAKAVLDSLNGVLWEDDDQIVFLTVKKVFHEIGCITVKVQDVQIDEEDTVRSVCKKRTRSKR